MSDEGTPVITIYPEPTPEELAAIVAAVTAALNSRMAAVPSLRGIISASPLSQTSRWARRGRLDAMRGLDRDDIERNDSANRLTTGP